MSRRAMRWWGVGLLAAASVVSVGQQTSAPVKPADAQNSKPAGTQEAKPSGAKDAKPADAKDAPAPSTRSLEEGRAELKAAEAEHPGNTAEVAGALVDLVYDEIIATGPTAEALANAERAVKVAEAAQGKESGIYATTLGAKAYVLMLGDHPELARPLAEEALGIEQKVGNDPEALAGIADTLIYSCQRAGDDACAERAAELQVKTLRGAKDVDPLIMVKALSSLMHVRRMKLDWKGAKEAADESMAIAARSETVTPDWSIIENNAGGFYMVAGDYQLALVHLKKSLEFDAQLKSTESISRGGVIGNLAYVEMCLGNTKEALEYYAQARELFAKRYGPEHSQTALVDLGFGYGLSFMGRYQESLEYELMAHRLQRERIRLAIQVMPEQQALAMANTGAMAFNASVSLATRHPEIAAAAVYQEVLRSRGQIAEEMAQRAAVLNRKLDPAVASLQQELEKERKAVMELQGAPPADNAAATLSEATKKMEQTERKLAERSAAFRADERANNSELGDLRQNMPAGSVLVSYVSFARYAEEKTENFNKTPVPSCMAFVLHRDSEKIGVYSLGDSKAIGELVKRMRASADAEAHGGGLGSTRNEREYREAGTELRKRIWDPLKSELQNAKLVLVVPDGVLNLVPFSALPLDTGYLVEHGPVVHILTSERDVLPSVREDKKAGLLAIGSPAFELARVDAEPDTLPETLRGIPIKCEAFTGMEFHPLPGSLNEVKEISSTFKRWNGQEPEQLLTGEDATRARFLNAAPQSRVLHVATHAFVLDKSCGNGNPLLHSGLVFAGANKSRNSSILTAQQIASLDLSGVDWAVLSACDTGNGELKDGEGVLGLERAFRVAGARSVVMALWPVDDEVTREFMRGLYAERFGRHASTADSVWKADRVLLKARKAAGKSTHPWYWAGFVGAGGWE
ncbi:MAG: CHAT domain-containing protein [Terracidiphilus sp.]